MLKAIAIATNNAKNNAPRAKAKTANAKIATVNPVKNANTENAIPLSKKLALKKRSNTTLSGVELFNSTPFFNSFP